MTKKQGYILDHWGKGSPSAAETAVLDQEVEVLKQEMEEASQKKIPSTVDTNSLISKVFIVVFFIISLIPHFLEQKNNNLQGVQASFGYLATFQSSLKQVR